MDIVKKYKELKKKDCVQLIKELTRRGLTSSCSPDEEKICRIVAYGAPKGLRKRVRDARIR